MRVAQDSEGYALAQVIINLSDLFEAYEIDPTEDEIPVEERCVTIITDGGSDYTVSDAADYYAHVSPLWFRQRVLSGEWARPENVDFRMDELNILRNWFKRQVRDGRINITVRPLFVAG